MRGMKHVSLWLRGWWLRDAVEGWLRLRWRWLVRVVEGREGVTWWRVNDRSFVFVVVVPAVVGVGVMRVVEGERHG